MPQPEICSALATMSDKTKVVFAKSDTFGGGTNLVVWDLMGNQAIKEMRYDAPIGNNDYVSFTNVSQVRKDFSFTFSLTNDFGMIYHGISNLADFFLDLIWLK